MPDGSLTIMPTRKPIDIEDLLQWALAHSAAPKLRVPSKRELTINPYDVHIRGCDNRFHSAGVLVEGGRRSEDIDADRVLLALDRLDPFTRAIVQANARAQRRPDWMEDVEPKLVAIHKRSRKRHRREPRQRWEPCSPAEVRACRELYGRWHAGLRHLAALLDDRLMTYAVNGLAAPEAPWQPDIEKSD